MNLLYISKYQFKEIDGKIFALPAYGNHFWQKYLDVFERVDVLAEEVKGYLDNGTLSEITDERISVDILPRNTAPKEFVNDRRIKAELERRIQTADAILIKPAARKGIMAIKLAEKYGKPYMIEMTGDLKLTLKNNPNLLKRMYNPFLHWQILRAIKNCQFGLYVTQEHLQRVYPIAGEQCGCTDTVLPYISNESMERRLSKISVMDTQEEIKIGMVASYHDTRKGIDTAIQALRLLSDHRICLHILGLGIREDREKWFSYAGEYGVADSLVFDTPVSGVENVLKWNEQMDICILPSRSEGLPRCIVESISTACPCIVSNVCGLPELVDEHWVHEPNDDKKLASLIEELLSDAEKMKQVAISNFERSKMYEFDYLKKKRNAFLTRFKEYSQQQMNKDN